MSLIVRPDLVKAHYERILSRTTRQQNRSDLARWITDNTYLGGRPFSFAGHEFQERILSDTSQGLVIMKSAQLGISEMSLRMALGLVMLMPNSFAIGYTFPTASFAATYSKTRFDPIVKSSPALRAAVRETDLDNSDVKGFGPGRFIYFKGAAVGNAAISDSLDMLIHDELDFSDPEIVGDYTSRMIHSAWKMTLKLSTPTFPGGPIDAAFQQSRRHFNLCKCHACNHWFLPSYYDHVRIPGFDKHLDEVTKDNLHTLRYEEAQLHCPACGAAAILLPSHREWVCENPREKHIAAGYKVSPHDAPTVITLPQLIVASTSYNNKAKFRQFSLGIPAADADSGLTEEEVEKLGLEMLQSPFHTHVMGIDLGLTCHFKVGGVTPTGQVISVYSERVPLKNFRERYWALKAEHNVTVAVSDIQPYTDLIMQISAEDPNLFAARYVSRAGMEIYDVRIREEDEGSAIEGIREVSVNRNALFDKLLAEMRPPEGVEPGVLIRKTGEWGTVKAHLTDMKRATATLRNGEFTSIWQKSHKGNDHYHHTLGYLWIAAQLRGAVQGVGLQGMLAVHKFKVKDPTAVKRR